MRRSWVSLALLAVLSLCGPVFGAPQKVVLFLVAGATYADLAPDGTLSSLRSLANQGGIALLENVVRGERTEPAIYLSMGAGRELSVPDKSGPRLFEGGIDRTVADVATEAYRADTREGNIVCFAYRRRFGKYPPLGAKVIHIGLPALLRAQPTREMANQVGALGEMLTSADKRISVYGGWQAALVGMDKRGAVCSPSAFRALDPNELTAALQSCDLLIYYEPRLSNLRLFQPALESLAKNRIADVLIATVPLHPIPPSPAWLMAIGPSFSAGTLLSTSKTGQLGIVKEVDIAPTMGVLFGTPMTGGTGHNFTGVKPAGGTWEGLKALQRGNHVHWAWYVAVGVAAVGLVVIIGLLWQSSRRRRSEWG